MALSATQELRQKRHVAEATAINEAAIAEGNRPLTAEEQSRYDGILKAIDAIDRDAAIGASLEQLDQQHGQPANGQRPGPLVSLGAQFVKSAVYEEIKKTATRGQGWHSRADSELFLYASTLTEDPASGGGLVVPTYRPGIIPPATPELVIADLFATGTTDSNIVALMLEKTVVNAAAAVLEGGVKPEASITFEQRSEPVRKLAVWLPCTDEILEDVAGLRSYLDLRLTKFIREEEEDQLLNGDGVAPNLLGILARPGLAAPVVRTDPDTNADAIMKQKVAIQAATNESPSGIVINPANWAKILLQKDTAGNYHGDGEFAAPSQAMLWGLPVAVSSRIPAGTALVGAFLTAAQIFRRGGIRVEASTSHSDFWIKNLVAIRSEERLALAVYRAGAFGLVTGLQ